MAKRAFSQTSCSVEKDDDHVQEGHRSPQSPLPKARKKLTDGYLPQEPFTKESRGSYALSRNYSATTRLNCQFFLWKLELGYSLHPFIFPSWSKKKGARTANGTPHEHENSDASISTAKQTASSQNDSHNDAPSLTPRIADLATGTAIWPLDIARTFPNAQINGFDISLQQSPPAEWLPENVTVSEWDIFSDLPAYLEGVFDVVHLRLLLLVIRNNDPRPVLKNAMTMLKEGGWIQWDELDPWGAYTISTGHSEPNSSLIREKENPEVEEQFQRKQELTAMSTLTWVTRLHEMMEEIGFEEVTREEIACHVGLAKYYQDMQFLVMEEEAANKGTSEERERVERAIGEGVRESREGRARVTPKVVCLGRRPRTGQERHS